MFALRRTLVSRASRLALQNTIGRRARSQFIGSVVSGAPRVRITQKEKAGLVLLLFGWWFPYPLWICWHFEYYKDPNAYEEKYRHEDF